MDISDQVTKLAQGLAQLTSLVTDNFFTQANDAPSPHKKNIRKERTSAAAAAGGAAAGGAAAGAAAGGQGSISEDEHLAIAIQKSKEETTTTTTTVPKKKRRLTDALLSPLSSDATAPNGRQHKTGKREL